MKKFIISTFCVLCICIVTICGGNLQSYVYAESDLNVNAKSAVLVDYNSGEILFSKNENEKLEIASMVKLMTTLLTIEAIENGKIALTDELIASENASGMGGSQVFVDANSRYSVEKMLQSVIMASANDASVALAEHIAGNEKAFVRLMNDRAKELGMNNTQYANSTGLPAPMQYSTATDTAKILSVLISNEIYHNYSSIWMDELVHPSGRKTEIVNTNKLTRYYEGCDSGKTGFTDEAGYCLVSSVYREDMRLVAVVIGAKTSKDRFNESVEMFNYGFANFTNAQIVNSEKSFANIAVKRSKIIEAEVFPQEDFYALIRKGSDSEYTITQEIKPSINAPVKAGETVGLITVSKNGVVVKEIPLIVKADIKALSYGEAFNKVVEAW